MVAGGAASRQAPEGVEHSVKGLVMRAARNFKIKKLPLPAKPCSTFPITGIALDKLGVSEAVPLHVGERFLLQGGQLVGRLDTKHSAFHKECVAQALIDS